MAIYQLFIQHIIVSLKDNGRAAIVVPTGFLTAKSIDKKIRETLIKEKILRGVVTMPSNIFATTNTNVSILFIDKNKVDEVILIDASKLGTTIKEGKNKKTILENSEEDKIIQTFNTKEEKEEFSVVVSNEDIKNKNFSFSAGQYFDFKIEKIEITPEEFKAKIDQYSDELNELFSKLKNLSPGLLT